MSRKLLSVLLAAFLVVGFASFMTKADVTGSFKADVVIQPIDCGVWLSQMNANLVVKDSQGNRSLVPVPALFCEDTLQKSDFETVLNINWTVSGLTLGFSAVAGFAGIEHLLTNLKATLGALNITDQFFFAVAYGTDTVVITNKNQTQTDTETAYTVIPPGDLLFVKKRVEFSISIAGITLDNLGVLEDTAFPKAILISAPGNGLGDILIPGFGPGNGIPGTGSCAELLGVSFANGGRCAYLPAQYKWPNGYTAASQAFSFGDTLTISGQTVSGITVKNITGINMEPQVFEAFKKISFAGAVCSPLFSGTTPKQLPSNFFTVEKIQVMGIPLGPVTWNSFNEFRITGADSACFGGQQLPLGTASFAAPFSSVNEFTFSTPIGAVDVLTASQIPSSAFLAFAVITLTSGGLEIDQELDQNLQLASTVVQLSATLNPDSNPATLSTIAVICQTAGSDPLGNCGFGAGLELVDIGLSIQRSGVTFSTVARFLNDALIFGTSTPTGSIQLERLRFNLSATVGPATLSLKAQLSTHAGAGSGSKTAIFLHLPTTTQLSFDRLEASVSVNF
jgi:hypothetical protein